VLLAACGPAQKAYENDEGGYFTTAIVKNILKHGIHISPKNLVEMVKSDEVEFHRCVTLIYISLDDRSYRLISTYPDSYRGVKEHIQTIYFSPGRF
jgi:hypothetical protein